MSYTGTLGGNGDERRDRPPPALLASFTRGTATEPTTEADGEAGQAPDEPTDTAGLDADSSPRSGSEQRGQGPPPSAGARDRRTSTAAVPAAVRRARRHAVRALPWATDRWRRSLQLRVASTTLLVSTAVVVVVGVLLVNTITARLLDAKQAAAIAEARKGIRIAERQLSVVVSTNDSDSLQATQRAVTEDLADRGTAGLFSIAVVSEGEERQTFISGDAALTSIPDDLRRTVNLGKLALMYAPIQFKDGHTGKGLIIGTPVPAPLGSFRLFYLFPLQAEEHTIALVRQTVAFTGILLVLLLGGIAALVTRQVVRPVRVAAQTAQRFASGRLEQRMQVHGRDEIALLASAFNDMADSLQRQIGKLEDMSRLQRRFTSDVSHELRTPLTTVRMAADVLYYSSRVDFPPEVARSAELLQTELNRFEALLTDLLEISRYDARVAVLEPEAVDVRSLVHRVVEATAAIADQQGSFVSIDVPDTPVVADVDARRVERILRNLVVNAIEHGAGKPVEVRLMGNGEAIAATVRDHGVGLRPGEAALVFDRFWRADPSRDRRTGGTGLGLSISLEDARLHGGWLHAWGRPGQGAQFRLTLPVRIGTPLVSSPLPIEPDDALRPRLSTPSATSGSAAG
jgi:two-component system, OmpR family, sensor histidine kinase MtrB